MPSPPGTTRALGLGLALLASANVSPADPEAFRVGLGPGADAWARSPEPTIRGITIGPIESALHPNRGYGTERSALAMREARRLGANWVSLTPFGRVWDLGSTGVDPTFEAPFEENRLAVARAVDQAHAEGLRVLLVPHLWVETGGWRALIDPGTDEGWDRWTASYGAYVLAWARVARDTEADMFSVGVELRSWVTTTRAPSFTALVHDVRAIYPGLVTYAANWDDVQETVILGELDVIGINAFYPLAEKEGAGLAELVKGGRSVAERLRDLAAEWQKPILFTEIGYTSRPDPAVRPWEWPDSMDRPTIDEPAQADAYWGLLAPLLEEPWFAGFFVWRIYADPDDMSQEAEWGFSPRGKEAELVVRDAFAAHWAGDGPRPVGAALVTGTAMRPGVF